MQAVGPAGQLGVGGAEIQAHQFAVGHRAAATHEQVPHPTVGAERQCRRMYRKKKGTDIGTINSLKLLSRVRQGS